MQNAKLWHARFGHVNYGNLLALSRLHFVNALLDLETPSKHVCEGCILGRQVLKKDGAVWVV